MVKFVDNKVTDNRGNNKPQKNDLSNKKDMNSKADSLNEIQVSDTNVTTDIEDNDYTG